MSNVTTLPARPVAPEDVPYQVGEDVNHVTLGPGVVVGYGTQGSQSHTVLEVDFGGSVGVKRFLAQYAPLSRAERTGEKVMISDQEKFDDEVLEELRRLEIRQQAQAVLRARSEPEAPPFDSGSLAEILARPPEPEARIENLLPWESGMALVAARKTGKTTTELNLARSLLTGQDFLGQFGVRPLDGNVTMLNFEVSAGMLARWADEHNIDRNRLHLVNLRGRRNPFGNPDDLSRLAKLLRSWDTEALIVDPFGRAYTGKNQNDPGEVSAWLVALDQFARGEAGARDVILAVHAGWNAERTRGASSIEDWADTIVKLTRDPGDESQRFLSAEGRDVDVPEDRLDFDPETRTLTLAGVGSRQRLKKEGKVTELAVLVVAAAREEPGANGRRIAEIVRDYEDTPACQDADIRAAAKHAQKQGHLRIEPGPNRSKLHYATALGGGTDA